MPDLKDEYMTSEQLQELLHVGRNAIWKMGKRGDLKPIKVGRRNLYKADDVREFLESREQR